MNLDKEKQYIINWLEKTSASGSYSFSYVCSQSFLNNWEIGKQFISDWLVTHGYKVKVINSRCFEISWDEAIADEW